MTFRPLPWLTFFTGIALIVLVSLGMWQLKRAEWKAGILVNIEQAQNEPPTEIQDLLAAHTTGQDIQFRKTAISGPVAGSGLKLLHVHKGRVGARYLYPVTNDQVTVLVDFGFVPDDGFAPDLNHAPDRVKIAGQMRAFDTGARGRPDNQPEDNQWYWRDYQAITQMYDLPIVPMMIEATVAHTPDFTPVPKGADTIPNRHMEYAWTWFLLGMVMIGVYLGLHVRAGRIKV